MKPAAIAGRVLADVATGQPVQDPRTQGAPMPDLLTEPWYAHPNDLIGGWFVLNRDHPPSRLHRDRDPDGREIGTFLGEDIARHIAALHNASLDRPEAQVGHWVVGKGFVPVGGDGRAPVDEEATR